VAVHIQPGCSLGTIHVNSQNLGYNVTNPIFFCYLEDPDKCRHELKNGEKKSTREAFLRFTLHFLRGIKQEELAERLQNSKRIFLNIEHTA